MLDIIITKKNGEKRIALINGGKLVEFYSEEKIDTRNEGNIFVGVVKDILDGMESAFVDIGTEKNSFIHLKDLLPKEDETKKADVKKASAKNIRDLVKVNDKILVQVKKDSNELKGARISRHVSLPSKYIVFMPNTEIITVSQKITNENEQQRLIKLVKENITAGNGAVIRTSAEGKEQEIIDDIKRQEKLWEKICDDFSKVKSNDPKLIYKSQDIVQKMLIDLTDKKIAKVISNN